LPRPKIIETSVFERALEVTELIDGFTYRELENAMNEIRESENPNKAYIELLGNIRYYKHILNGDTYSRWY